MKPMSDDPIGEILGHVEKLGASLACWSGRDDTQAQPPARRAAHDAIEAIDDLLATLHQVRNHLIVGIRRSDDAAATRVDTLLAQRHQREQP